MTDKSKLRREANGILRNAIQEIYHSKSGVYKWADRLFLSSRAMDLLEDDQEYGLLSDPKHLKDENADVRLEADIDYQFKNEIQTFGDLVEAKKNKVPIENGYVVTITKTLPDHLFDYDSV